MEPPREQLATSGKTVLLLLAPTAGTAVSSNPFALPTMPNQGGQLLPRLSQGLLWLWGSAQFGSEDEHAGNAEYLEKAGPLLTLA